MSYCNLVAQVCANRAEVFKRFRDFVCRRNGSYDYSTTGIGWTLHDSSYAVDEHTISVNDWFVIYSPGESGNDDLYFLCTYIANYIKIQGYLYWSAASNTGVQVYNTANNWNILDADVPVLWIYGDLDAVFGLSRRTGTDANFMPALFGKTSNPLYSHTVAVSAGALTAGSNVVINVGTVPADWAVGAKLFVRDQSRIDMTAAITAKTSSTVTATLANSYAAGAKVSADMGYFCLGGNGWAASVYALIDHAGSKGIPVAALSNANGLPAVSNPEALNLDHLVVPWQLSALVGGYLGEVKNIYRRDPVGMTALNVYVDNAGVNYRAFQVYNTIYIAVMEV